MNSLDWQPTDCPCSVYFWHTETLPNGWAAGVSDHSQSYAPRRRTEYQAYTSCRWWLVQHPRTFETLAEAKDAAVLLAMSQRDACADPACRVEEERRSPKPLLASSNLVAPAKVLHGSQGNGDHIACKAIDRAFNSQPDQTNS